MVRRKERQGKGGDVYRKGRESAANLERCKDELLERAKCFYDESLL